MNETAAIVGLYGAVDEAVSDGGERRDAVARLLPQYADDDFSWYPDLKEWLTANREGAKAEEFPGLADSLKRLGELPPPKCRMRPRRLFAMAVAARAFPDILNAETDLGALSIAALSVKGLASKDDGARGLLELLGDDVRLDEAGKTDPDLARWWEGVLESAEKRNLLSNFTGMRPRPCSGRVVKVPSGDGLAAAFVTEYPTSEVDFDQAVRFLNPVVWKECRPDFWCEMKQLKDAGPGGTRTYREVVSSDCSDRAAWFQAEAELDFVFWTLPEKEAPEVAITSYQLTNGRPHPGDLITVDEGSLVVAKTGGGQRPLLITTTKRIQFEHEFSAAALALMMCAFGYADTAGDLLCCAATKSAAAAKGKTVGEDFPGVELPARANGAKASSARPAPKAKTKSERTAGNLAEMFQNSANIYAGFLRGTAKALERGAEELPPTARTRPRDRKEQ